LCKAINILAYYIRACYKALNTKRVGIGIKKKGWIDLDKRINEIKALHELGFGLTAIAQCYGVSHQTVKNWLVKAKNYDPKRGFDRKKDHKRQGLNEHIDPSLITHVLDFSRVITNGSIADKHHSRKILKSVILGSIRNVKTNRIIYHLWLGKEEDTFKVMFLVQKALDQGENIKYLRSDRVILKVARALEKLGITLVVYPKDRKRPYNSRAEQTFTNIKKWVYANLHWIIALDDEEVLKLIKGVCEVYYNHNPQLILKVIDELHGDQLIINEKEVIT